MRSRLLPLLLLCLASGMAAAPWTSHGPKNGRIDVLAVAPTNRSVIYVAAPDGVFRTCDGGTTWADVTGPLVNPAGLVVSSASADSIVASAANGIYRSDDGGATWQRGGMGLPMTVHPGSLVADPRDPNLLYLVGRGSQTESCAGGGIFRSADGGRSFTPRMNGLPDYRCLGALFFDPLNPDRLYSSWTYSDASGLVRSDDAGLTWVNLDGIESPGSGNVVGVPASQKRYGIGHSGSVFLSSTDGVTWSPVLGETGIEDTVAATRFNVLDLDPVVGRIFLGASNGAYRSADGGMNWLRLDGAARDPINAIDFDSTSGAVIVGTDFGLFRSAGYPWNDWIDLRVGNSAMPVGQLVVDPLNGDVYAQCETHVFRSSDLGASWVPVGEPLASPYASIVVDAGHHLYSWDFISGVSHIRRLSPDGSWEAIRSDTTEGVVADPHASGTLYSLELQSIARTRDGGATWERLQMPSSPWSLVVDPRDSNVLIATTFVGVLKSVDGGRTWSSNKAPAFLAFLRVVSAPSDPDVLYMYARDDSLDFLLTRSADGGETWSSLPVQAGVTDMLFALVVDRHDPDVIYVSTFQNGIFRSMDGGKSWQAVSDGLPESGALSIAIDATGVSLHAGTPDRGVWELPLMRRRRTVGSR